MSQALLIAHPGHEIRLHHWLEQVRPQVCVLTDGSGGGAVSRIGSTEKILTRCQSSPGPWFGQRSDKQVYALIRDQKIDTLLEMAAQLEKSWREAGITEVTCDMLEGFNTAHDLVRCLCGAVVERLRRQGQHITLWDFPLEGRPDSVISPEHDTAILSLDSEAFHRKLEAAKNYPELASEVDRALAAWGQAAFQQEVRRKAPPKAGLDWQDPNPPYYEIYGAKMVALGRYAEVITFQEHMRPIAQAIWEWAENG